MSRLIIMMSITILPHPQFGGVWAKKIFCMTLCQQLYLVIHIQHDIN